MDTRWTCFFNICLWLILCCKNCFCHTFFSFYLLYPGEERKPFCRGFLHTVQILAKPYVIFHPEACSHFPGFGALWNNMWMVFAGLKGRGWRKGHKTGTTKVYGAWKEPVLAGFVYAQIECSVGLLASLCWAAVCTVCNMFTLTTHEDIVLCDSFKPEAQVSTSWPGRSDHKWLVSRLDMDWICPCGHVGSK